MVVDRLLVERIDLRGRGRATGRGNLPRDRLDGTKTAGHSRTLAPSRAKARATAPPMAPPAPKMTAVLSFKSMATSLVLA